MLALSPLAALTLDVLTAADAIPAHIAGRFRDPIGFEQSASGQYFVFDRRAHKVLGVDPARTSSWDIVQIGAEPGRVLDPVAFSVAPDGTFVIADAPGGRERVQVFTPAGFVIGGFTLPGRTKARVVSENFVLSGIGSLQYTGKTILMSQPETGQLFTEYALDGGPTRGFGNLRATGHEADQALHLALNSGIPLVDPTGGIYFVFLAGQPLFQKYDASGRLVFERHVEGTEIDEFVKSLPTTWPKRQTGDGELPFVRPTIRTAAVDPAGNLWIAFAVPYTYVYDRGGDKTRVVQFRGAGTLIPGSLFFGPKGRLLVTPGLYEFDLGRP